MRLSKLVPLLVFLVYPAYGAAEQALAIPWEELDPQEQRILDNAESNWSEYSAERRQKLLSGARKWLGMSRVERQQVRRNLRGLQNMEPDRRRRVLDRLQRFKSLPNAERARLRQTFQRYKRLPAERRREIRRKWQQSTPAERRELRKELNRKSRQRPGDAANQRQRRLDPDGPAPRAGSRDMTRERLGRAGKDQRVIDQRQRREAGAQRPRTRNGAPDSRKSR